MKRMAEMAHMQVTRRRVQVLAALGFNIYLPAFFKGRIFQGNIKGLCVPGLNCYSCPSAVGACPIGAIQTFMASLRFKISLAEYQFGLYVIGFLGIVGSLVGRMPCGWLCPFGLFQELVHKIPSPKLRIPGFMRYFRYVFLGVMVILLPLLLVDDFGFGETWFCKWVCPAGTLEAGIPLVLLNADLRGLVGFMFAWKMVLLGLFLVWMVFSMRPFCRTVCPLGAIFGLFNKASLFRMEVDEDKCTRCDLCRKTCPVNVKFYETPNSPDCIRCLKCSDACAYGAIRYGFATKKILSETT